MNAQIHLSPGKKKKKTRWLHITLINLQVK